MQAFGEIILRQGVSGILVEVWVRVLDQFTNFVCEYFCRFVWKSRAVRQCVDGYLSIPFRAIKVLVLEKNAVLIFAHLLKSIQCEESCTGGGGGGGYRDVPKQLFLKLF